MALTGQPSSDRHYFWVTHECRQCESRDAAWIMAVSGSFGPEAVVGAIPAKV